MASGWEFLRSKVAHELRGVLSLLLLLRSDALG